MRESVASSRDARDFTPDDWERFAERLHYLVGNPNQSSFYPQLAAKLEEMEKTGSSPNRLFYVSVPASVAPPIVEGLGDAGLANSDNGWTRIVLEKPFGRDLQSAHDLNEIVARVFEEPSVYRIDHYLGKENGSEHLGLSIRQFPLRASMEPQLYRLRRDHSGGNSWRRKPRGIL